MVSPSGDSCGWRNDVAIYHFAVQVLGRGSGRKNLDGTPKLKPDNAVAAAAYRAGDKLRDEREGKAQNYSRRGGVVYRDILVPEGAAMWLADREQLWNAVERMESRRDAQLAREINLALPHELSAEARRELTVAFVKEHFVARGMVADIALHDPQPKKGDDPRNFHAHIMLTLRKATKAGLHEVKTREWNSRQLLDHWRQAWAQHVNRALERVGRKERVDHRTLVAQRDEAKAKGDRKAYVELDRAPEIHIGPRPKAMQARDVVPVSRPRAQGAPRRARPETQTGQAPERSWPDYGDFKQARETRNDGDRRGFARRQIEAAETRFERRLEWKARRHGSPERPWYTYAEFEQDQIKRRAAEREESAERRLKAAEERWERERQWKETQREREFKREEWLSRQAEWEARKKDREQRQLKGQASPRIRDYGRTDQAPRIGFLWAILAGNNAKVKADLARIDRQSARFSRWLDYQNQKATWWLDGLQGPEFRRQRWLQSKETREREARAREKAAHAAKRAQQMKALVTQLQQLSAALSFRQERGLQRATQIERGWGKAIAREAQRGLERSMGRERERQRPNDPRNRS
jgi:hypothetical protein